MYNNRRRKKNHTPVICLVNFLPSCPETFFVDAFVGGQIEGHDVAVASVRAAWFRTSAQRLKIDDFMKNTD